MVCAICGLTRLDWCCWYRFTVTYMRNGILMMPKCWCGRLIEYSVGGVEFASVRPQNRDGQYFHCLAMWLYALSSLSEHIPQYRARAIALARDVHRAFVLPEKGVMWKMKEDLSGPYPGFGYGALDAFNGYVAYRILGEQALASEIMEMQELIERDY